MNLIASNIVTALDNAAIGTRVTNEVGFMDVTDRAIAGCDFAAQRVPGQAFIPCNDLAPHLSAGVGRRTTNPDDYVVRLHRGRVDAYLRRERAVPCEGAAIIVYTRDAYLADPDVQKDEAERTRIEASDASHVLVAVLGFAGPNAPLSPYRLVANLAGGNKEAALWTADEIRARAEASLAYDADWVVVAD